MFFEIVFVWKYFFKLFFENYLKYFWKITFGKIVLKNIIGGSDYDFYFRLDMRTGTDLVETTVANRVAVQSIGSSHSRLSFLDIYCNRLFISVPVRRINSEGRGLNNLKIIFIGL